MNLCETCANRRADTQCGQYWTDPVDGSTCKFMACKYCRSAEWACGAEGRAYVHKIEKPKLNACPICGSNPPIGPVQTMAGAPWTVTCACCGLRVTALDNNPVIVRWNCLKRTD